jgi:hypothetical protein
LADRVCGVLGGAVRKWANGESEGPDGMALEAFGHHDKLMLAGGIIALVDCHGKSSPPLRNA